MGDRKVARIYLSIVHPRRLIREGLKQLLTKSHCSVVAIGSDITDTLTNAAGASRVDVALCALVGDSDARVQIAALRERRQAMPDTKFVVLADLPSQDVFHELVDAGIDAVLSKDISGEILQRALQLVLLGQQFYPPPATSKRQGAEAPRPVVSVVASAAPGGVPVPPPLPRQVETSAAPSSSVVRLEQHRSLLRRPPPTEQHRGVLLSEREGQILACLVNGASNKVIARELQIAEATVKVHVKGLLRKIRVNNRTQAAIWALNNAGPGDHQQAAG